MQHVLVHFLLHTRDAFHATGHIHLAFTRDDALRRQGNGLQAGGAKTVDRQTRDRNRQTGFQGDLPCDVGTGGPFGRGATHDHILHFGPLDASALNRVLYRVAAQGGSVGHVEGALPAFGQRRACGRNNDGVAHDGYLSS